MTTRTTTLAATLAALLTGCGGSGGGTDSTTTGGGANTGGTAAGGASSSMGGNGGAGAGGVGGGSSMGGAGNGGGGQGGKVGNDAGGAAGAAGFGNGGSGAGALAPSCAGGLTCGNGVSCCQVAPVPGGTFLLPSLEVPPEHMHPVVAVEGFSLDVFPVTVGRFRNFVSAYTGAPPAPGAGENPAVLGTGWRSEWNARLPASAQDLKNGIASCPGVGAPKIDSTWTDAPGANESRPMSCVTWYEAFAFCAWDGGRLPGAAEREYAATGGDEQRAYPWGNQAPDASRLTTTCYGTDGNVLPVPVGGFPTGAGKWGHQDLLGAGPQMLFDCEFPPPLQTRVSPFWLC